MRVRLPLFHPPTISPATTAAPVPVDDTFPQPEVGPAIVPGPGVKDNDTISCGAKAVISVTSPPAHGSVTLSTNGGFIYTPRDSKQPNKYDMFEYQVCVHVVEPIMCVWCRHVSVQGGCGLV